MNPRSLRELGEEAPKLEYAGDIKFGPCEDNPLTAKSILEDWIESAKAEFVLSRFILPILNASDDELEKMARANPMILTYTASFAHRKPMCRWPARGSREKPWRK